MADIIDLRGTADFDAVVSALAKVEAQIKKLATEIEVQRALGIDTSDLEAQLDKAQAAAKALGDQVDAAAEKSEVALKEAGGAADDFGDDLDEAKESGLDLGNAIEVALGNVGAAAVEKLTEAALNLANALVDSAELVQKLRDRAEDLGRDDGAAADRIDALNASAASLGTTLGEIGDAALEGERKLQALGLGADGAADTIDSLLRVTVSARGNVDDFGDTVEALGQSFEAGGINLKGFVDELERRVPGAAEIAAAKLGTTSEGLEKVGVISKELAGKLLPELAIALEDAFDSEIADQIADTEKTLGGVKARIEEITNQIGGDLVPQLEALAQGFNQALDTETAEALVEVLTLLLQGIGSVVALVGKLGIAVDLAFVALSRYVSLALEGFTKIIRLIPGMGDALKDFDDALDITQDNLLKANRAGLDAFFGIERAIEDAADTAGREGPKIGEAIGNGFDIAIEAAQEAADAIGEATAETVEAARDAARERLEIAKELAEDLVGSERLLADGRIALIANSIEQITDAERALFERRIEFALDLVEQTKDAEGLILEVRVETAAEALAAAKEAAEGLVGVEREAALVRVKVVEEALEKIAKAEEDAAKAREESIKKQKDALDDLASGFAALAASISSQDVEFVSPESSDALEGLNDQMAALVAERDALNAKPIISLEESNRITELGAEIVRLQGTISSLGQSGQALEPLGVSVDELGVDFRRTISEMLEDGGALSELFVTLSGSARSNIAELVTEFFRTSEQVGSTEESVRNFVKTLVGQLKADGAKVPKELSDAFGDASSDIGTSTVDIAQRLADLDSKARETGDVAGDAADGVGEIGKAAGDAAEPLGTAALNVERLADGVIRITQARQEGGNPLEGIADPVSGENAEPLQGAAEAFERIGTALAGFGEAGPVASEAIAAILAAMQEAVEAGAIDAFAEAFERLTEAAPALAEALTSTAEPIQQISEIAPAAAEGLDALNTSVGEIDTEAAGESLDALAEKVKAAGDEAENGGEDFDALATAVDSSRASADEAGTAYADVGEKLVSLADTIDGTAIPAVQKLDEAIDTEKVDEFAQAIESATSNMDALADAIGRVISQFEQAIDAANELAAASNNAGVGG